MTKFIWVLVAGKSGARHQNCRKICDKVHLGLSSRKIWDKGLKAQENLVQGIKIVGKYVTIKVHLVLSSRKIWDKGLKAQENLVQGIKIVGKYVTIKVHLVLSSRKIWGKGLKAQGNW